MEKRGTRTTYGNLKMRKFALMNRMDVEREENNLISQGTLNEFHRTTVNLRAAERRLLKPILVSVLLAILLLFSSGCLENTMTGMGRMIQGGGEFVSGIGKDVIRGSEGYSRK